MQRLYLLLSTFILAALLTSCTFRPAAQPEKVKALEESKSSDAARSEALPHDPPANCKITQPPNTAFIPPAPYSDLGFPGEFWVGSNSLWTSLPQNGIWSDLPHNPEGYTQKVFWWREGYSVHDEPESALKVRGERLDADAPPLIASQATNAFAADIGEAMLVGVDFPTLGCWKITGKYKDAELSFVIWVAP